MANCSIESVRPEGYDGTSAMAMNGCLGHRLHRGILVAALVAVPLCAPAEATQGSASSTVQRFQNALIEIMKGGEALGFEGRRRIMAPVVEDTFDLPYITRLVVGTRWSELDPAQREAVSDAFVRMAIATIAARFNSYDGEEFQVAWERELKKQRMQVRGEFLFTDGEKVNIDYALHARRGQWQIINIWFDGVSGTRIQHEEFDAVLSSDGVEELIRLLNEKVAYYEGGGV